MPRQKSPDAEFFISSSSSSGSDLEDFPPLPRRVSSQVSYAGVVDGTRRPPLGSVASQLAPLQLESAPATPSSLSSMDSTDTSMLRSPNSERMPISPGTEAALLASPDSTVQTASSPYVKDSGDSNLAVSQPDAGSPADLAASRVDHSVGDLTIHATPQQLFPSPSDNPGNSLRHLNSPNCNFPVSDASTRLVKESSQHLSVDRADISGSSNTLIHATPQHFSDAPSLIPGNPLHYLSLMNINSPNSENSPHLSVERADVTCTSTTSTHATPCTPPTGASPAKRICNFSVSGQVPSIQKRYSNHQYNKLFKVDASQNADGIEDPSGSDTDRASTPETVVMQPTTSASARAALIPVVQQLLDTATTSTSAISGFDNTGFTSEIGNDGFSNTDFQFPDVSRPPPPLPAQWQHRPFKRTPLRNHVPEPSKTWAREDPPFSYRVIQRLQSQWVAILDTKPSARRFELPDLPPFIHITADNVTFQPDPQDPASTTLLVGDRIDVREISMKPGRAPQNSDSLVTEHLRKGQIWAHATGFKVTLRERRSRLLKLAGLVVATDDTRSKGRRIRVTCRYCLGSVNVPSVAMSADCASLKAGDRVLVWMFTPPENSYMSEDASYWLPPRSFAQSTEPQVTLQDKILAYVRPWRADIDGIRNLNLPFQDADTDNLIERIRLYEDLLLAASARAHELRSELLRSVTYSGLLQPLDRTMAQFTTTPCATDREFQRQARVWRQDAQVKIQTDFRPSAYVDDNDDLYLEDPASRDPTVGVAVLVSVEADEAARSFTIQLRAEPADASKSHVEDADPDLVAVLEGTLEAQIVFSDAYTGFLKQRNVFNQSEVGKTFKKHLPSANPLVAYFGVSSLRPPPPLQTRLDFKRPTGRLNKEQLTALIAAISQDPLFFQNAPPGTGKTELLAFYAMEFLASDDAAGALLLSALTNDAVQNIFSAIRKQGDIAVDDILFLQSNAHRRTKLGDAPTEWDDYALPAAVERVLQSTDAVITDTQREKVEAYIAKAADGASIHVDDSTALKVLLKYKSPKLILSTNGMLQRLAGQLAPLVSRLGLDECGTMNDLDFVATVALLPRCSSVFLTGDPRQARLSSFEFPDALQEDWLTPVTDILESRRVHNVSLTETFRFHEDIMLAVSHAAYRDELVLGRNAPPRTMFSQLPLRGASKYPILLFNSDSREDQTLTKSRYHQQEAQSAIDFAVHVRKHQPNAKIAFVTYYAEQARLLGRMARHAGIDSADNLTIDSVQTLTVDKMQGRESDYVVLCISRYLPEEQFDEKTFAFILDESRATVAISRAKEALVVIGHMPLLRHNLVWSRFIDAVTAKLAIRELSELHHLIN